MAFRFEESGQTLTAEELRTMRRSLSYLPRQQLAIRYTEQLKKCGYDFGRVPPPRVMQELVTLWKVLWKQKR